MRWREYTAKCPYGVRSPAPVETWIARMVRPMRTEWRPWGWVWGAPETGGCYGVRRLAPTFIANACMNAPGPD